MLEADIWRTAQLRKAVQGRAGHWMNGAEHGCRGSKSATVVFSASAPCTSIASRRLPESTQWSALCCGLPTFSHISRMMLPAG